MFDLSDEEAESIVKEFSTLEGQMALMDAVNTGQLMEEMVYPFEDGTSYLREDKVSPMSSARMMPWQTLIEETGRTFRPAEGNWGNNDCGNGKR